MLKKVALLFGGVSSEHEVSLQSAQGVLAALDTQQYEPFCVGITKDGVWLHFTGKTIDSHWQQNAKEAVVFSTNRLQPGFLFLDTMTLVAVDVVFPVLHGKNGEDGSVQGLCQLANIPCVGSDLIGCGVAMDKEFTHIIANAYGIQTPPAMTIHQGKSLSSILEDAKTMHLPFFVKPARSGSSVGITYIERLADLEAAVLCARQCDQKIILEEAVQGFEVGVSILGNTSLCVGEVDEVHIDSHFFSYENKYIEHSAEVTVPAKLASALTSHIKESAVTLFQACNLRGFARIDFFVCDDVLYLNEINAIPGLTASSRYPGMMKASGYSYEHIIHSLIAYAISCHHENPTLY